MKFALYFPFNKFRKMYFKQKCKYLHPQKKKAIRHIYKYSGRFMVDIICINVTVSLYSPL